MSELTDLPDSWVWTTIEEIANYVQRGKQPKYIEFSELPVINQKCIRWYGIQVEHLKYVDPIQWETWTEERFVLEGDILWNSTGTGTVGRAAIYTLLNDIEKIVVDSHVTIIRTKHCNSHFLHYWIMSPMIQSKIDSMQSGSTNQVELSRAEVLKTSFPLPPLNEQRRIVSTIEQLTDRSHKARAALEDVPKLIAQFRQSVLAAAFRGDLTADWREENPDVEPASELLERIKIDRRKRWEEAELEKMRVQGKEPKDDKWKGKYKEPENYDAVDLSELPDNWFWVSVDECTSLITDGEHATPERSEQGVYLLSARNVRNGELSLDNVDYISEEVHSKLEQRLKIKAGDVFLSCSGTVGRSCVVPDNLRCSLVRSVAVLRPIFEMSDYLSLCLRCQVMQSQIDKKKTQTAQANLFQGRIKILALPLAPIKEQQIIIKIISQVFAYIDLIETEYSDAQELISILDQSILAKAFRGELVPQDPNDEPAAALRERIRAERAGTELSRSDRTSTPKQRDKTTRKNSSKQLSIDGFE